MGAFTVPIQITNLERTQTIGLDALVDTGSAYTVVPGNLLSQLGVQSEDQQQFALADNSVVEYPVGEARMGLEGKERIVLVVFAPEGADALLGVTALELFSLAVDPVNQRLIPVPALLKLWARRRSAKPVLSLSQGSSGTHRRNAPSAAG